MSDDRLKIVSAASVSLEAYAAAFTNAFRGYPFPLELDVSALAQRVRVEQHDLENSLVAFDGAEAVGVAGLAVRGGRGRVAGMAVAPGFRGRGLGRRLMSALVERARAAGLRRLTLEVLKGNTAAVRLYEWAGMKVTRDLLILERASNHAAAAGAPAPEEAPAEELLRHFWRLHAEPPAWQRELPSLLAADLRGLRLGGRRRPGAYALLAYGREGRAHLYDLAAEDARAAEAMCAALEHLPGPLVVTNEPERSPFVAPLLARGFSEKARQHEMTVEL